MIAIFSFALANKSQEGTSLINSKDTRLTHCLRLNLGLIIVVHLIEAIRILVDEIRRRTSVEPAERFIFGYPGVV